MNLESALQAATDIARDVGQVLRGHAANPHLVARKSADNDLVTEADEAAETLIVDRLRAQFPDHHVVGEEGTDHVGTADYRWYIDPLDGTTNFAHGLPHYGVSIALTDGTNQPLAGVIYDPSRDECFAAAQGHGATLNGQPMQVSKTLTLAQSIVVTGFPYDKWHDPINNLEEWNNFAVRSQGIRRMGSAALDLAYVAAGRMDGYWEQKLNPWDVLAGVLLVLEAGGKVTDYDGRQDEVTIRKPRIVASNGHIHDEMLQVIRLGKDAPRPRP